MALLDIQDGFWALRRQVAALAGERLTESMLQQAGANGGAQFARAMGAAEQSQSEGFLRDCIAGYQAAGFGRFCVESLDASAWRAEVTGRDTFEAWSVTQRGQRTERPVCAYTAGVLMGFANLVAGRSDLVCVEQTCQAQGADACRFELLPADQAQGAASVAFDPDPFLSRQVGLLEILFDRMPMGIAVFDRNLVLRRCNPTWAGFVSRYSRTPAGRVLPGTPFYELAPGLKEAVGSLFARVLQGETIHESAYRLETDGFVSYWDLALTPLIEDGLVTGAVLVTTDQTERLQAYQTMERRVEERTREIERRREVAEGLREILTVLNSDRPLSEILTHIAQMSSRLLGSDGCAIYRMHAEGNLLYSQASQGIEPELAADLSIPIDMGWVREAIGRRRTLAVSDVGAVLRTEVGRGDPVLYHFLRRVGQRFGALIGAPLVVKDEVYGGLVLFFRQPRRFTAEERAILVTFGDQAALAIENARLRERAQQAAAAAERSRLARDLHDAVTQTLFSSSLIAEVLPRLWERNPQEGRRRLDELRQLTRGALAEMRTLLLELRPAALVEASLGDLLRQLAEAVTGRARLPVQVDLQGSRRLPADVQIALYRIAQEALNNVARHAGAKSAQLLLRCSEDHVELVVADDGVGFNLQQARRDHFGLEIMRERAASVGAGFSMESEVGGGTRLAVLWPQRPEGEGV